MNEQTTINDTIEQTNVPISPTTPPAPELPWWRKDLAVSGITEETLKTMGAAAPYVVSNPGTVWFGLLNCEPEDDSGPVKPRDLGEVLAFPYPGETFERDGEVVPFTRVKPSKPRVSGLFREWIEMADGTQRKLTAHDRRLLDAAEGDDGIHHGGARYCGPSGYKSEDKRKPVKYESPRRQGQRLYDVVSIFHPKGLEASDCLYLIEGEKKAICANANLGLRAYGLSGVTGAHDIEATHAAMDSGNSCYILFPKIQAHCELGGAVATMFDSPDVGKNPQVVRAQARILRAVQREGGKPRIAFIPDDYEHKRKRGIDDFFVEKGRDSVLKALFTCSALPFESLKAYDDCEISEIRGQLRRCLSLHAGAWYADDRQALKKWVRKASKVFDVEEEQVMEWCNKTAHVYQETSQQRIIRDLEQYSELLLGKGDLRMDERTQEIYLGNDLLRSDSAVTNVRAKLSLVPNCLATEPTRDDVRDAIRHIAERNQFHPVREYLDGLKAWDGTPRMSGAIDHLGIAQASRHRLQEVLLRKFLISGVARCYQPGCKVDTMLILHGPQGVRKSSVFKALCADSSWFTDQGFDVNDKDAVLTIGRFWLVEWSELDNLRRACRREVLKGFVTRQVDSVRPPYGRAVIDLRRSCIFCGTTNDDMFLDDATGHRRFWTISDVENVDVGWFEKNRDDLWAEAVAAYRSGEKWWLDTAEESQLKDLQCRHEVPSQWASVIEDYLTKNRHVVADDKFVVVPPPDVVTVAQILNDAVHKEPNRQTKADQTEVANVLKSLGWFKDGSRTRSNGRQSMWRRPGTVGGAAVVGQGSGQKAFLNAMPANCNGTPATAMAPRKGNAEEIEPMPAGYGQARY